MLKCEDKLKKIVIDLVKTTSLDKISITAICQKAKIKRQTFYYHYQSVYDLIYSIFYEMKIECQDPYKFDQIIKDLQTFLIKNSDFCLPLCDTGAFQILEEFVFGYLFRNLKEYFSVLDLPKNKHRELSMFYAAGVQKIILQIFKYNEIKNIDLLKELKTFLNMNLKF